MKINIWLAVGTCLTVLGLVLFCVGMRLNGGDLNTLSTVKYETSTYEIKEDLRNISVDTDTADVIFVLARDGMSKVVCHEPVREKHTVDVQDGTLSVTKPDTRKWFEKITFMSFDSPRVEIYLPEAVYEELSVAVTTGDVSVPEGFTFRNIEVSASTGNIECCASAENAVRFSASTGDISLKEMAAETVSATVSTGKISAKNVVCDGEMDIRVSTGKTELQSVCAKTLVSVGTTGDISLSDTFIFGKLSVERSTGDVRFENSDAGEIFTETSTGRVQGTLLSEKIFAAETDTGRIRVPDTTSGGKCEIRTDTGNIEIKIAE